MDAVNIGDVSLGAGRPRIIVPLTGRSPDELCGEAKELAFLPADVAEWRIDFLPAETIRDTSLLRILQMLRSESKTPLLATCRSLREGGLYCASESEYACLCGRLCGTGMIDAIDVEAFSSDVEVVRGIIACAHDCGVTVVASSHDFSATPDREEIIRRLCFMQDSLGADILKIAVMPQKPADVLTLLSATDEMLALHAKKPLITMSMGPLGVISRVSGQFFGSCATFGCARQA
ncbi:MAG: type I 3-dehydroquinate dehydratase, partial [Mailhella sp.]|nr:type I 3-dehydroquinate dehydratase [Mailhella sp.]